MTPNKEFWSGKKVLLTGHTGFKGSWLAFWLHRLGARVTGYALSPTTQQPLFHQLGLPSVLVDQQGDVNHLESLKRVVADTEPQVLIHMAAQSVVRESYNDPVKTFTTNVTGTVNVLEAVRSLRSIRAILVVTSDKCYENIEKIHSYTESDPFGGHDPYSSSKACAELVTRAYRDSFFHATQDLHVGIATARAGNVIGGGDWAPDRLVPDAIRAFSNGNELLVRFPNSLRPWQHVFEPLAGYLLLCEKLWNDPVRFSSGWNFGPASESVTTVAALSEFLVQSYGLGAKWIPGQNKEAPHEAALLQLDITKATSELGWRPRLDLYTAVKQTVNWYKSLDAGSDMKLISAQQLDEYNELIVQ